jgi:hypothetical protein
MEPVITKAEVRPSISHYGDVEMYVLKSDGFTAIAFPWFSDELSIQPSDVVGKTLEEARDLKQARDIAYLRS